MGWLCLGTGRATAAFLMGSGVDHGELIFDGGGGYRGWLVSDRPRATMLRIRDTVVREAAGGPAAILVADRVFIPLVFAMQGTGIPVYDVRRTASRRARAARVLRGALAGRGAADRAPADRAAQVRGEQPQAARADEPAVPTDVRMVETLRQRDGAPLLEIWRAEDPIPRLATAPAPVRGRGRAPDESGR